MESLKNEISERVEKMYLQRVWISRIQSSLVKSLGCEVPMELIREIINELKEAKNGIVENENLLNSKDLEKSDGGLKNIVKHIGNEKKYDYNAETDHIIFYPDWVPYPILRTTVLAMFEKYSKDWENLSGKQMQYEFQLTPKAWNFIKNTFNLMKDSVPFDRITLSNMQTDNELEESAQRKAEQLLETKMMRVYSDKVSKLKDKKIKEYAAVNSVFDMLATKLENAIKMYKPRDFDKVKIPEKNNNKSRDIFITDAHFGKQWTDGIFIRFKKLTRDLVDCEEQNINITFGGDLWELFVPYGEMHPWQRLWMEQINTEDLVMLIVDVFEQMLLELYKNGKKVTFNGMWGNHDRFTEKKELDPYRTPAMIVYRFLQKIVENTNIKVNILRDKINIVKSKNVKYVFMHGDWLSPAELNRIAIQQKEDWYYLVIVSGDKHSYKMNEISDSILWIQSPALAWQGKYDKDLSLSSLPWCVDFIKNNDWLIDVLVRRYK